MLVSWMIICLSREQTALCLFRFYKIISWVKIKTRTAPMNPSLGPVPYGDNALAILLLVFGRTEVSFDNFTFKATLLLYIGWWGWFCVEFKPNCVLDLVFQELDFVGFLEKKKKVFERLKSHAYQILVWWIVLSICGGMDIIRSHIRWMLFSSSFPSPNYYAAKCQPLFLA